MAKKKSKQKPAARPTKSARKSKPAAKPKPAKAAVKPTKPAKTTPKPTKVPKLEKPALAAVAAAETPRKGSASLKTKPEPAQPAPGLTPVNSHPATGNGQVHADEDFHRPLTDDDLRKVDTGLTKKDLEYFRNLLLEKRAEIVGSVAGMEEARTSGGGEMSHMPLHPADVGSDHFDQEFTLGLMESEKKLVREIDDALMRIQKGTYGVCVEAGKPIPRARLEITPWAKYCIEVVMEREKRGIR